MMHLVISIKIHRGGGTFEVALKGALVVALAYAIISAQICCMRVCVYLFAIIKQQKFTIRFNTLK